jgi:hypothetical protein
MPDACVPDLWDGRDGTAGLSCGKPQSSVGIGGYFIRLTGIGAAGIAFARSIQIEGRRLRLGVFLHQLGGRT